MMNSKFWLGAIVAAPIIVIGALAGADAYEIIKEKVEDWMDGDVDIS
jgi:hypothetical protein